jgi:hypothetical protein
LVPIDNNLLEPDIRVFVHGGDKTSHWNAGIVLSVAE